VRHVAAREAAALFVAFKVVQQAANVCPQASIAFVDEKLRKQILMRTSKGECHIALTQHLVELKKSASYK